MKAIYFILLATLLSCNNTTNYVEQYPQCYTLEYSNCGDLLYDNTLNIYYLEYYFDRNEPQSSYIEIIVSPEIGDEILLLLDSYEENIISSYELITNLKENYIITQYLNNFELGYK